MANTTLYRTSGSPTSDKKGTLSIWIKRDGLGNGEQFMFNVYVDGSNRFMFRFQGDDSLTLYNQNSGTGNLYLETTNKFQDTGAYYHLVAAIDTTQATAANRAKIYKNGVECAYAATTYPNQNDTIQWFQSGKTQDIGEYNSSNYLRGNVSHVQYVDGVALAPTEFGEDDNGSWKIKSGTYSSMGNNGFHLKFETTTGNGLGTDSSSNNNHLTLTGAGNQQEDNPSNAFNKFLSEGVVNDGSGSTVGGLGKTIVSSGTDARDVSIYGLAAGKWYWEMKVEAQSSTTLYGISTGRGTGNASYLTETTSNGDIGYGLVSSSGNMGYPSGQSSSYGSTTAAGDFLMFALDITNNKFYIGKNGSWFNSGNPAGNSNGWTINNISAQNTSNTNFWYAAESSFSGATTYYNFGDGYFNTVAAGTNADGAGYGKFKYSVPSGFYSICTKNILTYG